MLRTLWVRTLVVGLGIIGWIAASTSNAATRTWSGGGLDANWATPLNWVGGVAPTAGDALIFDGFGKLTNNNNLAVDTNITGLTFAPTAGAFTLAGTGNRITLGGDIVDNTTLLTQTVALQLLLNANRNVNVTGQGVLVLSGAISDGGGVFGLNKTGAGLLTLSGANTFTGPINITGGTLAAGAANNLGGGSATGAITINGATFRSTGDFAIPTTRGIVLGPAGGAGSGTIETLTGSDITYSGVIANNTGGTGSLNKIRFGTLTLGGANTYTGATNVRNGSIILNFADAAAPTTNIINSASTLVLGGATAGLGQNNNATLSMTGKASTANVQTFNNTNIDIYGSVISATNGATGGTARINLGALTHTLGGTLVVPTNSGQITTTTNVTTTNGILGGWAIAGTPNVQRGITMGTDFATVGPDNGDGTRNIIPYTSYYTTAPLAGTGNWVDDASLAANADKNVKITIPAASSEYRIAAESAGATLDINTLAYDTTGGNNSVLTIGTGNTLRLGRFGAIYKPNIGNSQIFIGGTGGTAIATGAVADANAGNITAGGAPNTPGEIVLMMNDTANNNGGITIVSNIVDNGTGAVTLIKTSVMSIKLDGHNSYSGGTYINQGRFQLAGSERLIDANSLSIGNPDGLGTGPVTVAPGAYLFLSGVNGNGQFTGPGAIPNAYFRGIDTTATASSAQNAPMYNNITISGNGTSQEGIGAIRLGGRSILFGQITLGGDARIGGGNGFLYPRIELNAGQLEGATLYVDPGNLLSGKVTGDFNFDIGAAVSVNTNMILSNTANDWGGQTTILGRSGGNSTLRLGASEVVPHGAGKGNLVFSADGPATLDMQGFSETVNGLSSAGSVNPGSAIIQNNGFTAVIDDPTPADLTDDNQTYIFTAGTSTLTVGGFDQSADFGGIIRDNDATPTVTLPNPNYEGPADPELDPATVIVTSPWATAGSKIALTKIGAGIQTLGGANTYTGNTNINGGTLSVTGSLAATGSVLVNSGGTLGGTGSVGNVTVASGGNVAPGTSIGTITVASLTATGGADLDIEFALNPTADAITVTGAASFSGTNTITPGGSPSAGVYTILNAANVTNTGTLTLNPFPVLPDTRPASGVLAVSATDIKVTVTGGAKTLTWTGATNSTWDKGAGGTTNWVDPAPLAEKFFNADGVTFADGPTNRNVTLNVTVEPGATVFNNSTGNNYTVSGTGSISGLGGITKNNTGNVTISTNNTFTGPVSVTDGQLTLSGSNTTTLGVSGGTLLLTGSNTGGAALTGGIMDIGNGGASGSLTGAVANDAVLRLNRSDDFTFPNTVSGSGTVEKVGTNIATLSGASTYTGPTNILAGTVQATNSSSLGATGVGAGAVTISSGAALDVGGTVTANSINFGADKVFNIVGTGVGGTGVLTNSNATVAQQNAFQKVNLTGNATIGGPGRFDIRAAAGATLTLNNNTLTKVGSGQFTLVAVSVIDDGNIVVNEGTFAMETSTQVLDFASGTKMTFNDGSTLQFFNTAGATNITRPMELNGTVTVRNNDDNTPSEFGSAVTMKGSATYTWAAAAAPGNALSQHGVISDMVGQPRGIEVKTTDALNVLNLTADNTFKGSVAVTGPGTLNLSPISGTPYIADTANVSLGATSIVNLGFTGTDTINALIIDGVSLAAGVYDAVTHPLNFTGGGTLTVLNKILPGDFDGNNTVDAADYVKWRDNEGTFTILANDPLSGTEIDQDQYNIWRSHFGNTLPGSGGGAGLPGAVPEPGAVVLALMAMVGAFFLRSRGAW